MAGQLLTYSFARHVTMINNREIKNFADGDDVVSYEYREDGISDVVGADGNMQASVSADQSATITIKLLGTAPENDYLEELYFKFLNGEIDGVSVALFDSVTGKGEVATNGYIPKLANKSKGKSIQEREWTIIVPKLDIQKPNR